MVHVDSKLVTLILNYYTEVFNGYSKLSKFIMVLNLSLNYLLIIFLPLHVVFSASKRISS